jgi:hypothetical protein
MRRPEVEVQTLTLQLESLMVSESEQLPKKLFRHAWRRHRGSLKEEAGEQVGK